MNRVSQPLKRTRKVPSNESENVKNRQQCRPASLKRAAFFPLNPPVNVSALSPLQPGGRSDAFSHRIPESTTAPTQLISRPHQLPRADAEGPKGPRQMLVPTAEPARPGRMRDGPFDQPQRWQKQRPLKTHIAHVKHRRMDDQANICTTDSDRHRRLAMPGNRRSKGLT